MRQWPPGQLTLVQPAAHTPWEAQAIPREVPDHSHGRALPLIDLKEGGNRLTHLLVGVQDDSTLTVVSQPHRQRHPQFSPARLVTNAALEAGTDPMPLP